MGADFLCIYGLGIVQSRKTRGGCQHYSKGVNLHCDNFNKMLKEYIEMQIEKISLNDLKPYDRNTKKHTAEQIEQIKDSIRAFGNNDPICIWKDNEIIAGHGRYIALKELGYKEAYCIRLDHLSDKERKAYAIAHNKLTMNTGFDNDLLKLEFEDLQNIDFDLDLTGFEEWEYENLLSPVSDDDLQDFFVDKEEKAKEPKKITCPSCGCEFEK